MDSMSVRLRRCRHALGRTQSDVATAVGVSNAAISKWESDGSSAISAVVALRIARYLNVNPYWLVFGQGQATDRLQCRDLSESAHEMAHRFDLLPKEAQAALTALIFAFDTESNRPTPSETSTQQSVDKANPPEKRDQLTT
jgi:transcriptional regulator with XRE-family HTH domain